MQKEIKKMIAKEEMQIRVLKIREAMQDKNLLKVSKLIGVNPMSLYRLQNGITKRPTNLMLTTLEKYLNITE